MAAVAAPELATQQHTPLQERKGEREEREGRRGREGREERERRGGRRGKRVGQERYSTSCFGPSLRRTVPTSFVGQTLSSHALQSGVRQSSFSAISLHPSPHLSPQLGQQ